MSYKEDVRMIKALADENRLRILECLHHGEKCACVILEELSITQSTLSHHMRILTECGLVNARKEGKWSHYSLNCETLKEYNSLLKGYPALMVKGAVVIHDLGVYSESDIGNEVA
mgnify:CR=1 FL=1